jgi:capsule polysaccharide export protein KpsE/RkpR
VAQQSEQIVSRIQNELAVLKTDLDQRQNAAAPALAFSPTVEEALCSKIRGLEQQLAVRFSKIESRETERAQDVNKRFKTAQSKVAAIKADAHNT